MYNHQYPEMIVQLWNSEKVSQENKEWIDKLSTRRTFKFSQKKMIEDLYIQVFGQLPKE